MMAEREKKLLEQSRDGLKMAIEREADMRRRMKDDLRFCALDQWDAGLRAAREAEGSPCLTIDKINPFIVQVVNDIRQNRPSIKARPVDDVADVPTAKIIQGLIRNIEDQSKASIAYDTAADWQVKCGLGYFRILTERDPKSFDQDIRIKMVPDIFSVYLGRHYMPYGSDAREGWIFERLTEDEFKEQYPKADFNSTEFDGVGEIPFWKDDKGVTLCEYYYFEKEQKELVLLADRRTMYSDEYDALEGEKPPEQRRRKTTVESLKWCKHSGVEILEERDVVGDYIPIVEVIGNSAWVDGERMLWGVVRPSKDSLRGYNFWMSAFTARVALAPKAPFVVAEGQIDTHEGEFEQANRGNPAVLTYKAIDVNGQLVPAPQRQAPAPIEIAMVQMMQIHEQNVRGSLGMYNAALGKSESQQSGRAILALQRESDTGTYHFPANMSVSVEHGGRIVIGMIPKVIDKRRVIRILGEDGSVQSVQDRKST